MILAAADVDLIHRDTNDLIVRLHRDRLGAVLEDVDVGHQGPPQ
jgi:hypothetical protein